VLKGTTASALYGSLGKDGAIMITTKKGQQPLWDHGYEL
jgi:TonB-dependent SusC/RagA subfamily outer membrane receptor